ncbi:MAG: hypothetical protein E6R13_08375 [Spirochaetes bacterium]|nr:MAG: hypothetical protein E6R13_08375 [Spirochaetota bacterium]
MSGFAKSFDSGFFHILRDYQCIAFIDDGGLTIDKDRAICIDYSDPDDIKFVDTGIIVHNSNLDDISQLMSDADSFCEYLGINVAVAKSELRRLFDENILGKAVTISGQVR